MEAIKTVAHRSTQSNSNESPQTASVTVKPRHGVITLSGYGISARVDKGHLIVQDGVGDERRACRFARVNHGIRRVVVIGNDGSVSLAALRWLADQKASFVMLERDGSVLLTTGPVAPSDARMRRAQALIQHSDDAVEIARELINRKLDGQQGVLRCNLKDSRLADAIAQCTAQLPEAATIRSIRAIEAQGAKFYWSAWRDLKVAFPSRDLARVPEHWQTFGPRSAPFFESPRHACNPANAMLNFLYTVLESEVRLTIAAIGLDPGFGLIHVDSAVRDSLIYDLMEPIRPQVDSLLFGWLTRSPLKREWFFEQRDGICRLMPALVSQLAETAKNWEKEAAQLVEWYAKAIALASPPQSRLGPGTRLTRSKWKQAMGMVPATSSGDVPKSQNVCKTCGVVISRYKSYCTGCAVEKTKLNGAAKAQKARKSAHSPDASAKRRESMRKRFISEQAWNPADLPEWITAEVYTSQIQPRLSRIPRPVVAETLGVSVSYVAQLRTGIYIPHRRFWKPLAELVEVHAPA